jgi:hypothetical protein
MVDESAIGLATRIGPCRGCSSLTAYVLFPDYSVSPSSSVSVRLHPDLTALPEGGGISMGPGTLNGSLDRMMRAGLIEESEGTDDERRRYYRLTRFGRRVLDAELLRLNRAIRSARNKYKLGVAHS